MQISDKIKERVNRRDIIAIHKVLISSGLNDNFFKIDISSTDVKTNEIYVEVKYIPTPYYFFEFRYSETGNNNSNVRTLPEVEFNWDAHPNRQYLENIPEIVKIWIDKISNEISEEIYFKRLISDYVYNPDEGIKPDSNLFNHEELKVFTDKIEELKSQINSLNNDLLSTMYLNAEAIEEIRQILQDLRSNAEEGRTKKEVEETIIGKIITKSREHVKDAAFTETLKYIGKGLLSTFSNYKLDELPYIIQKLLA